MKLSKIAKGRVGVYIPNHPKANNRGYVLRSRYNMEQYLNRYLDSAEIVHHCDEDELNDDIGNLELILRGEHTAVHNPAKKLDYEAIKNLRSLGFGYKRIAKALNYPLSSVKSAVWKIEQGSFKPWARNGID